MLCEKNDSTMNIVVTNKTAAWTLVKFTTQWRTKKMGHEVVMVFNIRCLELLLRYTIWNPIGRRNNINNTASYGAEIPRYLHIPPYMRTIQQNGVM